MKLTENQWQWVAIVVTITSLISTSYFNHKNLQAARIDSELISYLNLSERYQRLMFELIKNDHNVFQKTNDDALRENKYLIYEVMDLFSIVHALDKSHKEVGQDFWPTWCKRMQMFFKKPAVQHAWKTRRTYAEDIYPSEFVEYIDQQVK